MRNVSIDLLKIISIYFVILSHVCLCFFEKMTNDYILNLFRQSGQLGVSLFYMCSGYFLLNKKNSNMVNYFLIKSKKISFVLLVWLTIYYFYDKYFVCKYIKNCDIFFIVSLMLVTINRRQLIYGFFTQLSLFILYLPFIVIFLILYINITY